tara:strand:- start:2401 stop:2961 length:561 start_codon:yes stop_codon:yes gene_type:complete
MSDKKTNIKTVDCSKSCKMTNTIRESDYCNKQAKVVDGSVFYGCSEALKSEPKEVRQFYSCDLWNMGLEDSCNSCELICINNKNKNLTKVLKEQKDLENLIKDLSPHMVLHSVTPQQVNKISSTYSKKNSKGERNKMGAEAIKIANFANEALKLASNGRRIDLAFYSLYARRASARIKKLKKETKD